MLFSGTCTVLDRLVRVHLGALTSTTPYLSVCTFGWAQANPPLDCYLAYAASVAVYLMSGWVGQLKPFWVSAIDSFMKAYVKEWAFIGDEPADGPNRIEGSMLHSTNHSEDIPVTPRVAKQVTPSPR